MVVDSKLFAWCLQRLPDLMPSTEPLDVKMSEAQGLADQLANRFTADDKVQCALKKMCPGLNITLGQQDLFYMKAADAFSCAAQQQRPKALGKIRQKRLAAREHLKAIGNILSQMGVDFSVPRGPLTPINCMSQKRAMYENRAFKYDIASGSAQWDVMDQQDGLLRVVIQADEGSPMHSAVQYLMSKQCLIHFIRDEPQLRFITGRYHLVFPLILFVRM